MKTILEQGVQLAFNFIYRSDKPRTAKVIRLPKRSEHKCRNPQCSVFAIVGKAYCSKAHSPFGLLEDEPDNAPIEWATPDKYYSAMNRERLG